MTPITILKFVLLISFVLDTPIMVMSQTQQELDPQTIQGILTNVGRFQPTSFRVEVTARELDPVSNKLEVYSCERINAVADSTRMHSRTLAVSRPRGGNQARYSISERFTTPTGIVVFVDTSKDSLIESSEVISPAMFSALDEYLLSNPIPAFGATRANIYREQLFFWTAVFPQLGSLSAVLRDGDRTKGRYLEIEGFKCAEIECAISDGSKLKVQICPDLNFMVVSVELESTTNHGRNEGASNIGGRFDEGPRTVARLANLANSLAGFTVVWERQVPENNEYRTVHSIEYVYSDIKYNASKELSEWQTPSIPEGTPIEMSRESQIDYVWREGDIRTLIDSEIVERLDNLPEMAQERAPKAVVRPILLGLSVCLLLMVVAYLIKRRFHAS